MAAVDVSGLRQTGTPGNPGMAAVVRTPRKEFELFFTAGQGPLASGIEPFLAGMLLPAMRMHIPLHVAGSVSRKLLGSVGQIQEIFHAWDRDLMPIAVTADTETAAPGTAGRGVAAFLSGGLDSFYTILRHLDEIDALITVHGYAIRLAEQDVRAEISRSLREAAAELGKPLIEVETNIQDVTEDLTDWLRESGPALMGVALLLAPRFRKIYIPAGRTYATIRPAGSHALLDRLWNTEQLEFVHDGLEATRVDKARLLGGSDAAMKHLRVCWGYLDAHARGLVNCGHCEKCLRTQINLYLAGVLDRSRTFDHNLDYAAISRMPASKMGIRIYIQENLEIAEKSHADPALIQAMRDALEASRPAGDHARGGTDAETTVRRLRQENESLRMTVQALHASRSWRLTRPLRALGDLFRRARP